MPRPRSATDDPATLADQIADASPDLDPEDFDVDEWVSGVTKTVRAVKLYRRGDLVALQDDLQQRLRVARAIPDEDRGLNDESPEAVAQELERVARDFEASAAWWKVEGRTNESRERIAKRLKKDGVTDEDVVSMHQLADAVIKPEGVTVAVLARLRESSEAQYNLLVQAYVMASGQAPRVDVPFSSGSSADRRRDRSS